MKGLYIAVVVAPMFSTAAWASEDHAPTAEQYTADTSAWFEEMGPEGVHDWLDELPIPVVIKRG